MTGLIEQSKPRYTARTRRLNPARVIAGASDGESQQLATPRTPLHIEQWNNGAADPTTAQYIVTLGGLKDGVGTILIGKQRGLERLDAFLRSLSIPAADVETALRVLTGEPRHQIPHVKLTQATLRRLRA
jgi:hypothetical protein